MSNILELFLKRMHLVTEHGIGSHFLLEVVDSSCLNGRVLFRRTDQLLVNLDLLFMLLFDILKMLIERLLVDQILLVLRTVSKLEAELVKSSWAKINVPILILFIEKLVKIIPNLIDFTNFGELPVSLDPLGNGYIKYCWKFWCNLLLRDHADVTELNVLFGWWVEVHFIGGYQLLSYILIEAVDKVFGFGFLWLPPIVPTHEQNCNKTWLFNFLLRNLNFSQIKLRLARMFLGRICWVTALELEHLLGQQLL